MGRKDLRISILCCLLCFLGCFVLLMGLRPWIFWPLPDVTLWPKNKTLTAFSAVGEPPSQGPLARIGTDRFRHPSDLWRATFSPDGQLLYSQTYHDPTVKVWEVSTGKLIRDLAVDAPHWTVSADGKTLAVPSRDNFIHLCDTETGKTVLRVPCSQESSRRALSPKGRYLGVADFDGGFHLRELPSANQIPGPLDDEVSKNREKKFNSIAFTPDERYLVLSRPSNTPLVWDLFRQKVVRPFAYAPDSVSEPALLASGPELLTLDWGGAREYETIAYVSRLETGEQVRKFTVDQEVDTFAVTGNGRVLAVLGKKHPARFQSHKRASLWDTQTGKQIGQLGSIEDVHGLTFSPDGKTLATMGQRAIRLWEVPGLDAKASWELVEKAPASATSGVITSVAFAVDGTQLVSAGSDGVIVWDLSKLELVQRLTGQRKDPMYRSMALAVSPDGRTVLAADGRYYCWEWQYRDRRWEPSAHENHYPSGWIHHCLAYSPDGTLVAVGQRKTEMYTIVGPMPSTFFLCRAGGDSVSIGKAVYERLEAKDIGAVAFSPDGRMLAIASGSRFNEERMIHLLDLAHGRNLRRSFSFGGGPVTSLAFSPDGDLLALGAGERDHGYRKKGIRSEYPEVLIWQVNTGRVLDAFAGHDGMVHAVAFSPSGKLLLTAGEDHMIRCWKVDSGEQVAVLKGHVGAVTSLAFSPDGKMLASGSDDTMMLLWDVQTIPGAR